MLVPGLSAGTLALIMGIYEKIFLALKKILTFFMPTHSENTHSKGTHSKGTHSKNTHNKNTHSQHNKEDLVFLFCLILGGGMALFTLAKPLSFLLSKFPLFVNAFFLGLIIASVPSLFKMTKKGKTSVLWIAFWTILFFSILEVGPLAVLSQTSQTSQTGQIGQQAHFVSKEANPGPLPNVQQETPNTISLSMAICHSQNPLCRTLVVFVLFFLSGLLAVFASALPGISGSYLLMLLGMYHPVILSLAHREWIKITIFSLGGLVGFIIAIYVVHALLKKYKNMFLCMAIALIIAGLTHFMPSIPYWPSMTLNQWIRWAFGLTLGLMLFYTLTRLSKKPQA